MPFALLLFGQSARAAACPEFDINDLRTAVPETAAIVVVDVETADADGAVLLPVAFLRGATSAARIPISRPQSGGCPIADMEQGTRVLVVLYEDSGYAWPGPSQVYALAEPERPEDDSLVRRIRAVTGQYAVPAGNDGGAAIDWGTVVVPVGAALAFVFGIGLFLMRIWHRIDPT